MCEVRSREKRAGTKKKESTMVSSKKKWTVMNPIRRPMKKRNPSSGHNGQLVHWWVLIHSGRRADDEDVFGWDVKKQLLRMMLNENR